MSANGRNIKVEELNERRLTAVRLRLSGVPLAEAASRSGLSRPTVIDAVKAYREGGWTAVPVRPRGRAKHNESNIKHFFDEPTRSYARLGSASHLQNLESESIHIMREVVAEASNPVMLYSIGKDSSVMLHLARKAFHPGKVPFPLLHIDTGWKFREMYAFRDRIAAENGLELIVHINAEGREMGIDPFVHGSAIHTDIMKTRSLKQALDKYRVGAAFGGARRDEEKSRAKERIFSFRSAQHQWDPKNQRPELWKLYNLRVQKGESMRVFPLSNWTELDVWLYIYLEKIPVVPLYFAKERPVVERDGMLLMVDDERMPLGEGEVPALRTVRFRTLGCYPLTGAIVSDADTVPAVIQETLLAHNSERHGRVIDHDSAASMEKKKRAGYF
jgi:sulfate adenylyltransferase subunit 2